MINTYCNRAL